MQGLWGLGGWPGLEWDGMEYAVCALFPSRKRLICHKSPPAGKRCSLHKAWRVLPPHQGSAIRRWAEELSGDLPLGPCEPESMQSPRLERKLVLKLSSNNLVLFFNDIHATVYNVYADDVKPAPFFMLDVLCLYGMRGLLFGALMFRLQSGASTFLLSRKLCASDS